MKKTRATFPQALLRVAKPSRGAGCSDVTWGDVLILRLATRVKGYTVVKQHVSTIVGYESLASEHVRECTCGVVPGSRHTVQPWSGGFKEFDIVRLRDEIKHYELSAQHRGACPVTQQHWRDVGRLKVAFVFVQTCSLKNASATESLHEAPSGADHHKSHLDHFAAVSLPKVGAPSSSRF
jgi:hypothetical protein